eukprot:TRINITY_DN1959_c0_g3_i1.p1 TRINITY_DN1959_c0_g3~~TRINITY_DN1959_c0_g3_i1.p1  ORF type:complete len:147 (-),score=26.53 TRINITY_DN1959_c0_g3_i1:25-465(-)
MFLQKYRFVLEPPYSALIPPGSTSVVELDATNQSSGQTFSASTSVAQDDRAEARLPSGTTVPEENQLVSRNMQLKAQVKRLSAQIDQLNRFTLQLVQNNESLDAKIASLESLVDLLVKGKKVTESKGCLFWGFMETVSFEQRPPQQ